MDHSGKIVLITGASSGIGREAALRFAARGDVPVLGARSVEKLVELAAEIRMRYGVEAPVYKLDVKSEEQVQQVASDVLARFGRVDILVNNAGYGLFRKTVDLTMDEIADMMDVNYLGLVRMTKALLPSMLERRSGHIINISSLAGFFAASTHGCYAATKFAVMGFSESLRYELNGTGVRLSTVNPGPVETAFWERADRTQLPRFAVMLPVEKVADAVIRAAEEQRPLYLLPKIGGLALRLKYLFPRIYDWVMTRNH
jgi:short-subunit dehydrogenase